MHPVGGFLNPSDRILRHLVSFPDTGSCSTDDGARIRRCFFSFPENMRCIGSTDGWIAVDCQDAANRHTYLLHNEFSGTTLSLPELDTAIGNVSELFEIHKGVWLPKWHADHLTIIIDVAFLGDRLYGITLDEDLVFLDITFDDNGVPMVTGGKCVIGEHLYVWSDEEDYVWSDDDDDDDDDSSDSKDEYKNNNDVVIVAAAPDDDGLHDQDEDDDSSDCEDDPKRNNDDDYGEIEDNDEHTYDLTKMTDDDIIGRGIKFMDVDKSPNDVKHDIEITWYLIESCGKLLMVRRQMLSPGGAFDDITHKVDVFEADVSAAKWVPVKDGLGGQALFISSPFCKSVSATCSEEIQ
ncbi:hypothetical protein ACQ4PT_027899 [Festuca glaucescens]